MDPRIWIRIYHFMDPQHLVLFCSYTVGSVLMTWEGLKLDLTIIILTVLTLDILTVLTVVKLMVLTVVTLTVPLQLAFLRNDIPIITKSVLIITRQYRT
jgi:hypothetical protein